MRLLARFLLVLSLGAAILWAVISGEELFPGREEPARAAAGPRSAGSPPVASIQQGEGAIAVTPRGQLRIDSYRRIEREDGSWDQRPRYRLRAADSEPNRDGTYTLTQAEITFFGDEDAARPILRLDSRTMTLGLVTGEGGFQLAEDQEMLLAGVEMRTAEAFGGGTLRLRTDRALVLTAGGNASIRTPDPEQVYRIDGEVGGGRLELKGRGLEAVLPLPETRGAARPAPDTLLRFKGLSANEGEWTRGDEKVLLGCQGPLEITRPPGDAAPVVELAQAVRIRRQIPEGSGLLRGDRLRIGLEGGVMGLQARIRWLQLEGAPALLEDTLGELRARRIDAAFREDGSLLLLVARENPIWRTRLEGRGEAEARCTGPLRLAGLPVLPGPGGFLADLWAKSLPGYRLALEGRASLNLPDSGGPLQIDAADGVDALLSRQGELLALAGAGASRVRAADLEAASEIGFTRCQAPWAAIYPGALTWLGPPAGDQPTAFNLTAKRPAAEGDFRLDGIGLLLLAGAGLGRLDLDARAAGARSFLALEATRSGEAIRLAGADRIRLDLSAGGGGGLTAEAEGTLPLRLTLPGRGLTAWGRILQADRAEMRLFGREGEPALLAARREQGEEPPLVLRLLAPWLKLREGLLRAGGGIDLALSGAGLPGVGAGTTRFLARELELEGLAGTEAATGEETARLNGEVQALVVEEERITWAGGDELLVFLAEKKAFLAGSPEPAMVVSLERSNAAQAAVLALTGGGRRRVSSWAGLLLAKGGPRSLAVVAAVIRLSPEETVAGQLEQGLGGRLLLTGDAGREGVPGALLEASSRQPIGLKSDLLTFTGYTTLRQATLSPNGDLLPLPGGAELTCGTMTCWRDPETNRIDLIRGEKGVFFRKGDLDGRGSRLLFLPGRGELSLWGGEEPCRIHFGDQLLEGPEASVNLKTFLMSVRGLKGLRVAQESEGGR